MVFTFNHHIVVPLQLNLRAAMWKREQIISD